MADGRERSRGEVSKGFDDGLSKAFELALTPAVLGVVGWWVDARLELTPLFTLVFFLLGVAGTSLSVYYRYDAAMKEQESAAAAARAARPPRRRMTRTSPPEPFTDELLTDEPLTDDSVATLWDEPAPSRLEGAT